MEQIEKNCKFKLPFTVKLNQLGLCPTQSEETDVRLESCGISSLKDWLMTVCAMVPHRPINRSQPCV